MKSIRGVEAKSYVRYTLIAVGTICGALLTVVALAQGPWSNVLIIFSLLSLIFSNWRLHFDKNESDSKVTVPASDTLLLSSAIFLGLPAAAIPGVFAGAGGLLFGASNTTLIQTMVRLFPMAAATCLAAFSYSWTSSTFGILGGAFAYLIAGIILITAKIILSPGEKSQRLLLFLARSVIAAILAYPIVMLAQNAPILLLVPGIAIPILHWIMKPRRQPVAVPEEEAEEPIPSVKTHEKPTVSLIDPLTEVANQRYLMMFLNQEISRSLRNGSHISILLVDVDGLARINTESGREDGDKLLKGISRELQKSVRDYDVVARYAGDEFVVVLPETEAQSAFEIAERIHHNLIKAFAKQTSTSIGVATYPDHGASADDLISSAHHALNRAKFSGKNTVRSCHRLARAG